MNKHNFRPINPPMRAGQTIICNSCSARCGADAPPVADMNGRPFVAFYCQACAAKAIADDEGAES